MPKRDRAEYMRRYRARRRGDEPIADDPAVRITELEDEVARLKRELAARAPTDQRKAAQAKRDEWLRRVQRMAR